jgi:probable F420-dependent oxidoreductase
LAPRVAAIGAAVTADEAPVTKLEVGSLGVALAPGDGDTFHAAVVELEKLGYATIWLTGGQLANLEQVADVVRATRRIPVATGIISVDRFDAAAVAATYAEIEATHPGRLVVGLGGAHGAKPLQTLAAYLDRLDTVPPTVPASRRVLAALGPRMLQLARDRAAGALPVLVTPAYTAHARSVLGDGTTLAVEQLVVLDTDSERARQAARGPLGFLGRVPAYQANFRRMGFTEDDVTQLSDRLVDALVAWGDVDAIVARISEHRQAGADQVAVSVVDGGPPQSLPVDQWRQLAKAVSPP